MSKQQFDVFLAHNSNDKTLIRYIYHQLKVRGIHPWLDEEEIAPGTKFQDEIQEAIGKINATAIFFGKSGIGRWQALELKSFISQCIKRDIPIIPVLLPGVEDIPEELIFLQEFNAVFFRDSIEDEEALSQLEWGITGKRHKKNSKALTTAPAVDRDYLGSEKGIDYRHLRDLLKAEDWKEADQETSSQMLKVMGKNFWLDASSDDLFSFPCLDLITIDQLWIKYSQRKFGFSVQKEIYTECGATLNGKYPGREVWISFLNRVGWYKNGKCLYYSEMTFSPSAPRGHLPHAGPGWNYLLGTQMKPNGDPVVASLSFRLKKCKT